MSSPPGLISPAKGNMLAVQMYVIPDGIKGGNCGRIYVCYPRYIDLSTVIPYTCCPLYFFYAALPLRP